jgi:hypothetical protein
MIFKQKKIILFFSAIGFFIFFLKANSIQATITSTESNSYKITWPNLNSGSATPSAGSYKMGVTMGQIAPGLYEGNSLYNIKSGFQYIHSIVPFTFTLDKFSIDFGSLEPLTAKTDTIGITVTVGSAGGYSIRTQENKALTSTSGSTIIDTLCDASDCDQDGASTWENANTRGFGFNMTGDDIPSDFSGGKYRQFANATVPEDPVEIMGNTPSETLTPGTKNATMTLKVNVLGTQEAGVYENMITFTALPTY